MSLVTMGMGGEQKLVVLGMTGQIEQVAIEIAEQAIQARHPRLRMGRSGKRDRDEREVIISARLLAVRGSFSENAIRGSVAVTFSPDEPRPRVRVIEHSSRPVVSEIVIRVTRVTRERS